MTAATASLQRYLDPLVRPLNDAAHILAKQRPPDPLKGLVDILSESLKLIEENRLAMAADSVLLVPSAELCA